MSRNQSEEKEDKLFEWQCGPTRIVYPIDYSENEFSKKFFPKTGGKENDKSEGNRAIVSRLTNQVWFRKVREKLLINSKKEEKAKIILKESKRPPITIPLETAPLCKNFISTMEGNEAYKKRFPEEEKRKGDEMDEKTQETFLLDLFKALHEEIQSESEESQLKDEFFGLGDS